MKKTATTCCQLLILTLLLWAMPGMALADDGLLVVVTEEIADETGVEQAFWWSGGERPAWSATDLLLKTELVARGPGFAEPLDLTSLSRVYRRPAPSDANAVAMASVFGHTRVIVGTVRLEPTRLRPVGLSGWRAVVDVRLVERGGSGTEVVYALKLDRVRWSASDEEAREAVRHEAARAIASGVGSRISRNVGPVGVASDELLIGVRAPSTRPAIDAVRAKLETFAGVTSVRERWAAEGIVVLEVNPGVADPRNSVLQYLSLLVTEGAGRWSVRAAESQWPNVAAIQVEEQAR